MKYIHIYPLSITPTETPPAIIESYRNFWIENSVPSPSPHDTVIEKDVDGKCIKIGEEYKTIQKRFYVEYDYELFDGWKFENAELIEEYLTSKGAKGKKTNINTFKKYRPNYIEQTNCLTQFACDNCTDWSFVKSGLDGVSRRIHDCGSKECDNYDETTMAHKCTCDDCSACLINKYAEMDSYILFEELCCDIDGSGPNMVCAEGTCLQGRRCGVGKYRSLLLRGIGCHRHKRNIDIEVEFKRVVKVKVDEESDIDYKFVVSDSLPWKEYVSHFAHVLQKQITHRYAKRKQNTERRKICRENNGMVTLPKTAAFTGIDYIANKKLKLPIIPQGMNAKILNISMLVLYECRNVNDNIEKSTHISVRSNCTRMV